MQQQVKVTFVLSLPAEWSRDQIKSYIEPRASIFSSHLTETRIEEEAEIYGNENETPIFLPERLIINRKRFSTTQGEVELIYDGKRIEQFGDTITLDKTTGKWTGHDDAYWHLVAELHLRDNAKRGA